MPYISSGLYFKPVIPNLQYSSYDVASWKCKSQALVWLSAPIYVFTQELEGCYYELLPYFISVSNINSSEEDLNYHGEIKFNTTSNQTGTIIGDTVLTFLLTVTSGSYIQVNLNISNTLGSIIFSSQSEYWNIRHKIMWTEWCMKWVVKRCITKTKSAI